MVTPSVGEGYHTTVEGGQLQTVVCIGNVYYGFPSLPPPGLSSDRELTSGVVVCVIQIFWTHEVI